MTTVTAPEQSERTSVLTRNHNRSLCTVGVQLSNFTCHLREWIDIVIISELSHTLRLWELRDKTIQSNFGRSIKQLAAIY